MPGSIGSIMSGRTSMLGGSDRIEDRAGQYRGVEERRNRNLMNWLDPNMRNSFEQDQASGNQISQGYNDILNNARNGVYSGGSKGFNEFADNGGWNPTVRAGVDKDVGYLRNWARNSISPEDQERMRGGGVFDEASKNGLYSDADLANIRSRSNTQIPAFYDSLKGQLDQQNRVQGTNPGFSSQMAKMAREQSQGQAQNAVGTEVGIKDRVNEGRRWGTEGMSRSEAELQSQLARNTLGGLGLAGNLNQGMMDSINRGRVFGISGQNEQGQQRLNAELGANRGLADLRGQTPAQTQMFMQSLMQMFNMDSQQAGQFMQVLLGTEEQKRKNIETMFNSMNQTRSV